MGDFKLVQLVGGGLSVAMQVAPQGVYDPLIIYTPAQAVSYLGSSYAAIQNTQGNLPTNTVYWMLLATGGEGPQGPQGPQGLQGPPGVDGDAGSPLTITCSDGITQIRPVIVDGILTWETL